LSRKALLLNFVIPAISAAAIVGIMYWRNGEITIAGILLAAVISYFVFVFVRKYGW
jgi:hypothetical protein